MQKYDVIVAGGGFAGVAAAVSAARCGRKVLLFERANCLGGAATNCLVNPFMPYHTVINGKRTALSAGIFKEITDKLNEFQILTGGTESMPHINEEHLKIILNRMVLEAGVSLLFHAVLTETDYEDGKIKSVTVATKSGNLTFCADYFIDATGDADLAAKCNCSFRLGRDEDNLCQPMTLCFRASNVDVSLFYEEKPALIALYKQ